MKITTITQHALDRYFERSGCVKPVKAMNKLFSHSEHATPIGNHRYYNRGWIFVIVKGVIKTCYKPRTREQQQAVYNALNP